MAMNRASRNASLGLALAACLAPAAVLRPARNIRIVRSRS